MATGLPLISLLYASHPDIGALTLPLLIWHPMQTLVGSMTAPVLGKWTLKEKARLRALNIQGGFDSDDEDDAIAGEDAAFKALEDASGSTTVISADAWSHQRKGGSASRPQHQQAEDSTAAVGSDGVTVQHHSLGDETLTLSDHTPRESRRYRPKCHSDHRCYEVGIVYHMCTESEELLNMRATYSSSRNCRGCGIRITTREGKRGIRPSPSFPVYICMDCKRYIFCHNCWSQNKVPDWATTLYDLYN
jgi:hypothetical protein